MDFYRFYDGNPKLDYVLFMDELPSLYDERFQMIVSRAANLINLSSTNIHFINDASLSLSNLIDDEFSDYFKPIDEPDSKRDQNYSTPNLLYQNLSVLSKLDLNFTDSEYFGILALSLVDQAIQMESVFPLKEHQYDWGREDEVLIYLTEAVEATCFGEALNSINSSFSSTIASEIKRRNQKGPDKRFEPNRKIKNNFLRYIDNKEHKVSNAQAARSYFQSLCEKDKRILCHTLIEANAVRTLTDYLRDYKKKISPE
jgi:hypothetical protein